MAAHAPGPVEQHFGDLARIDVQECLLYHEHDDDSGRYRYKVVRAGTRRRGETEFRWFGSPDLPTAEAMHLYWLAIDKGLIFTRMFHYNGNKDDEKEALHKKQKSRYEPLEHVGGKFISEAMRKHSRKVREAKAAGVQPAPFRERKAVKVDRGADDEAPPDSVAIAGSNELSIGSLVVAKDKHGGWYKAKVIAAMQTAKQVMKIGGGVDFQQWQVHFEGWHKRHDEWLAFSDGHIRWRKAPPPPASSPPPAASPAAPAGFVRKRPAFDLNYSSSSEDDVEDDAEDDAEEGCDNAQNSAAFAAGPRREGEEPMDEDVELAAQDESSSSDEEEIPLRAARSKPPSVPTAPIPGMVRTDSLSPKPPSMRSQASSDAAVALLQVAGGAAPMQKDSDDSADDDEDVMISSLATK